MDHTELAKRIRKAIFDRAEEDGRVMHADAMDEVIKGVLTKHWSVPTWPYAHAVTLELPDPKEWR